VSTIAAVRAQVAARLLATGVLTRESAEPIDTIRSDSHSPVHLEYAVGSPSQEYTARGKQSRTEIEVVIAYHLPPKDRVTGYDTMLGIERTVVASLQTSDWGALNPRLASLTPVQSSRAPGPDGWIWLTITFTALHYTL
jgi:hypothetical protein